MRIIGITALLATALIGGCKKEKTQPNVTGNNLVGTRNQESAAGNNLVGTRDQESVAGNNQNLVGNTAAVEDYSSIFDDLDMDAKLKADFKTEMAKLDEVFKNEMKNWGLDVAALRSMLEKEAEEIGTEFPEIKNEVSATAASFIKVLELAVAGEGIIPVLMELQNAFDKLEYLEKAARAIAIHTQVGNRVEDLLDFFNETISSNPKTEAARNAIEGLTISVMQVLSATHPEIAESLPAFEEMLKEFSA